MLCPMIRVRGASGMTLVETLMALALLGIGLMMGVAVVAWSRRVELRAERRAAAVELAAGVAERLRAADYAVVTSGDLPLGSEAAGSALPDPRVELVVDEDEDRRLKTVGILVSWQGRDPGTLRLDALVGAASVYAR